MDKLRAVFGLLCLGFLFVSHIKWGYTKDLDTAILLIIILGLCAIGFSIGIGARGIADWFN